jgi:hypothetical protein
MPSELLQAYDQRRRITLYYVVPWGIMAVVCGCITPVAYPGKGWAALPFIALCASIVAVANAVSTRARLFYARANYFDWTGDEDDKLRLSSQTIAESVIVNTLGVSREEIRVPTREWPDVVVTGGSRVAYIRTIIVSALDRNTEVWVVAKWNGDKWVGTGEIAFRDPADPLRT